MPGFGDFLQDTVQNPLVMAGLNAYLNAIQTPRLAGWGSALAHGGQAGLRTLLTMPYIQAQTRQAQMKANQAQAMEDLFKTLPETEQVEARADPKGYFARRAGAQDNAAVAGMLRTVGGTSPDMAANATALADVIEKSKTKVSFADAWRVLQDPAKLKATVASMQAKQGFQEKALAQRTADAAAGRAVTERGQDLTAASSAAGRAQTAENAAQSLDLRERTFKYKQEHPTAGKVDDPLITLTTMKDDLEELKKLYAAPEGKAAVGGVAGHWTDVQKKYGGSFGITEAPDAALALVGVTSRIQSKLGNLLSGKVLSDNEVLRLKNQLPDYQTSPKAFETGMKNFETELNNIIAARKAQGLRVPESAPISSGDKAQRIEGGPLKGTVVNNPETPKELQAKLPGLKQRPIAAEAPAAPGPGSAESNHSDEAIKAALRRKGIQVED